MLILLFRRKRQSFRLSYPNFLVPSVRHKTRLGTFLMTRASVASCCVCVFGGIQTNLELRILVDPDRLGSWNRLLNFIALILAELRQWNNLQCDLLRHSGEGVENGALPVACSGHQNSVLTIPNKRCNGRDLARSCWRSAGDFTYHSAYLVVCRKRRSCPSSRNNTPGHGACTPGPKGKTLGC